MLVDAEQIDKTIKINYSLNIHYTYRYIRPNDLITLIENKSIQRAKNRRFGYVFNILM